VFEGGGHDGYLEYSGLNDYNGHKILEGTNDDKD